MGNILSLFLEEVGTRGIYGPVAEEKLNGLGARDNCIEPVIVGIWRESVRALWNVLTVIVLKERDQEVLPEKNDGGKQCFKQF